MKGKSLLLLTLSLLLLLGLGGGIGGLWEEVRAEEPEAPGEAPLLVEPVGTAFTYQGRLTKDGSPVNETCNFWFSLWDAAESGTQVGSTQLVPNVTVNNGLFTVQLNGGGEFGDTPFNGQARWLEIMIRCPAGSGDHVLLGPRQALTPTPYALALPGLYTQQTGDTPNIIGGYRDNEVAAGAFGATISGGGWWPEYLNRVTDHMGTVGGGYGNQASLAATVSGGRENTASAEASTIGGGYRNEASGPTAIVSGGADNLATGESSTIGGGWANLALADYATVPGGCSANASHYGQMAYASGKFVGGIAQTSVYVMRIEKTCLAGVWYDLYLDGQGLDPANYLTMADGRTMVFDALAVGRTNAGESAGYYIWGVVENVGGTATLVNWSRTAIGEDDTTWDVQAATLNDALFIQVQGNGETIRWVATMRTAEVSW